MSRFRPSANLLTADLRRRRLFAIGASVHDEVTNSFDSSDSLRADQSREEADPDVALIQERIERPAPLTWLFTGTDYRFDAVKSKRSFIEFFSDFIKRQAHRQLDVIVDSTYAEHAMLALNKNASWRVTRFEPDIVFVMLSPADLEQSDVDSFREALHEFIEQLQDENCAIVICLPSGKVTSNQDLRKESGDRIHEIAKARHVVVIEDIDHATPSSAEAEPEELTSSDHQELAQRLLRRIGLLG